MPDTTSTEAAERFDPDSMHGQMIESEHLVRYRWATQFASDRRVLDAACGTGYGSALLAAAGASGVVGIDLDEATIERARSELPGEIQFVAGDVSRLPFADDEFDLVVSFETIEHLSDPERGLDELRRVLAPGGLLVLSSPNRGIYTEGNPHHLHEYTPEELSASLTRRFEFVRLRRQHTWIASGIFDDAGFAASGDRELEAVELRKLAANTPGGEIYTLAVAGDAEPPEDHSVVALNEPVELRVWDRLWQEQRTALSELLERLANREREIGALRTALLGAEHDLAELGQLRADFDVLSRATEELREIEADRDLWFKRYEVVVNSTSWKLTAPLRDRASFLRSRR